MTNPENDKASDEIQLGDFFVPLLRYRHLIWHATVAATALTILVGGLYFFWQPAPWSASLEFRPVFAGASIGQYPNRVPFSSTDVVDPTVLDQVYDENHVQGFCAREAFRSGFVVEESSAELQFLDLDYQARLADARLTQVDRDKVQNEYRARRQALPVQYRLTWLRPDACRSLPPGVAFKALTDVLQTWANDSDLKRGVLKLRVAMLTPAIFDFGKLNEQSLLIRADLIRSALTRLIDNVREVEALPGAETVRYGEEHLSFIQVRSRLEDLVHIHLDPLVAVAGRGLGTDSIQWVEQSLSEANVRQKTAEERATAYQTALREYSGVTAAPSTVGTQRSQTNDVQTLTPQIDRTFIDRIVELSATNTTFRQELTRSMVAAKVLAADSASTVEHYKLLLASLKTGVNSSMTVAEVDRRLSAIVAEGTEQARQFNLLHNEFSRIALRSGPSMYRVEGPPVAQTLRSFTLRSLMFLVVAVLLVTPIVVALGALVHHAVRQIVGRPLRGRS
jgi:hypothetical protein